MDLLPRRFSHTTAARRLTRAVVLGVLAAVAIVIPNTGFAPVEAATDRHSVSYFRQDMWRTVRADHPVIQPVAAAIRAITTNPLEQLVLVNDVSHLLIDYDDDARVYGSDDFHATLDEMIARRRAAGWAYMRDDCDGRAVFAAHLLAALGIEWRFEASYWKEHAWVIARVGGVDFDLLDLRKGARETDRLSYKLIGRWFVRPSHRPPGFNWRAAWASRTGKSLEVGLTLGMLTLNSTRTAMHHRNSTDWTRRSPGGDVPPLDDASTLIAGVAAFPFGEPLRFARLANVKPEPTAAPAGSVALAGTTEGNTSP